MFYIWLRIGQDQLHKNLVKKILDRKFISVGKQETLENFSTKEAYFFKIGMKPILDQDQKFHCLFHLEHPIACKLFYEVEKKCLDTPVVNGSILSPIIPHDHLGFSFPYSGLKKNNQEVKIETVYTGTKIKFIFKLISP